MLRRNVILGFTAGLLAVICVAALILAGSDDTRVANAAMKGDKEAVRSLLKQAADVNAAQGDGMTALHWAALNGDSELAQLLLYAGANIRATTRIGGYTPLFMAAKNGNANVVDLLLKANADPKVKGIDGLTPLMVASMAGDRETVRLLLDHGAEVNAKEAENGQTALMFAASFNRADVIDELAKHGADLNLKTPTRTPAPPTRGFQVAAQPPAAAPAAGQPGTSAANAAQQAQAAQGNGGGRQQRGAAAPAANAAPAPQQAAGAAAPRGPRQGGAPNTAAAGAPQQAQQPAVTAGNEPPSRGGGSPKGALTPLMYASRDGSLDAVKALVKAGAKLNETSADNSTALLLAAINGKFDVAKYLVEQGADLNVASTDGAEPLYAVVHTQWSRESFHPQPTIKQEKTSYLDLMQSMLDHGADPNARLSKVLWYSSYGYAYEAASEIGTTPFWRCAAVADVDGMKLLLSRGADPNIPNKDGVNAFLIASGAGTHGNDEVNAPAGRMTAVRYLVEDLHFDVNASDSGGSFRGEIAGRQAQPPAPAAGAAQAGQPQQANPFAGMAAGGFTAIHNAASRGDNEMILYLVAKGAKVDVATSTGITPVDMANGPRQRVQPFPETIALLEMLGAKNSHKCVSC
jgi:ankyrin repeat protein